MSDRDPSLRRKKTKSGSYAVVTLPDGNGGRREICLGKWKTKTAEDEYDKQIARWKARGRKLPKQGNSQDLTVAEVIDKFLPWCNNRYRRPDGSETGEYDGFRYSLRPLLFLHGDTEADQFDSIALAEVRNLMVNGYSHPQYGEQRRLARNVVNQRIKRIQHMFKWAAGPEAKKMVDSKVWHDLKTLESLTVANSYGVKESQEVGPVARLVVIETLPFLRPQLQDMVLLQLESAMRPGELVMLRACDLDMSRPIWRYTPARHKTAHHGHKRVIAFGPKCRQIIEKYLTTKTDAYLFSPKSTMEERARTLRANRATPVQPSQVCRKKTSPKKKEPGDRYTRGSYSRSIYEACDRAFLPPEHLRQQLLENGKTETKKAWKKRLKDEGKADELKSWRQEHRWHVHQLRHTRADEIEREFDTNVMRAVLGHRSINMARVYTTLDMGAAAEAITKIG